MGSLSVDRSSYTIKREYWRSGLLWQLLLAWCTSKLFRILHLNRIQNSNNFRVKKRKPTDFLSNRFSSCRPIKKRHVNFQLINVITNHISQCHEWNCSYGSFLCNFHSVKIRYAEIFQKLNTNWYFLPSISRVTRNVSRCCYFLLIGKPNWYCVHI